MKKSFVNFCILLFALGLHAQIQPFELQQVRITGGPFKNAQDVDLEYMLKMDPDRLLAPYLIDAGLQPKADKYGNWESMGLSGHIGGHYLSALAMMYASTGNPELKSRLDYMLTELDRCQKANGNGYVGGIPDGKIFWERIHEGDIDGSGFGLNNTWVPLYNIHKVFKGLHDAFVYTGNPLAKKILIGLGDWFINLIEPLSEDQIQQVLRTEHGGISESFANLYTLTKDPKYLKTAEKLIHKSFVDPLLHQKDSLTGMHANTQIPKVIGYEKIAELTENKSLFDAAKFFWKDVALTRSVAFGGNSVAEHFNPVDDFQGMLKSNEGPETCNSYNMERLTKALYFDTGDISYLDFYERTMYNHILSTEHPVKGGFVYFTPIRPNQYRVYSQPETSMWCCVGTGLENHTKYGELIYSHSDKGVYVNLFIPSTLHWDIHGLELTQSTKFPFQNQSEIKLKLKKSKKFTVHIRYPKWAENFKVFVNGSPQTVKGTPSEYISITRRWKSGDNIKIEFSTSVHLEQLPDKSPWVAFVSGPIVLAAKTSRKDLKGLFADASRMGHVATGEMIPLDKAYALVGPKASYLSRLKPLGNLHFKLDSLELEPFFQIYEDRYQMYFHTYSNEDFKIKQEALHAEEQKALALKANTIDLVNCGEQQPEVEHGFKGAKSFSGFTNDKFWRATRDYMSYQLQNKEEGKFLVISTLDPLKQDNMSILINGKPLRPLSISENEIRFDVHNMKQLDIRISSKDGEPTNKFHQIRIIKN